MSKKDYLQQLAELEQMEAAELRNLAKSAIEAKENMAPQPNNFNKKFKVKMKKMKLSKQAHKGEVIIECSDEDEAELKRKYREAGDEVL